MEIKCSAFKVKYTPWRGQSKLYTQGFIHYSDITKILNKIIYKQAKKRLSATYKPATSMPIMCSYKPYMGITENWLSVCLALAIFCILCWSWEIFECLSASCSVVRRKCCSLRKLWTTAMPSWNWHRLQMTFPITRNITDRGTRFHYYKHLLSLIDFSPFNSFGLDKSAAAALRLSSEMKSPREIATKDEI